MAAEVKKEIELEIAHVLFIDIVGYSKLLIDEQRDYLHTLNEVVRETDSFRAADAAGKLTRLPTGDGMALVFATTPNTPVSCALEISKALRSHPELQVRMGIHSGPVSGVVDVSGRSNIAGAGINLAQRVMDCGDAGHILLSKHVADDLEQYRQWRSHLHDLGECEVKHDVRVHVVNLYTDELGNHAVPEKLRHAREGTAPVVRVQKSGDSVRVNVQLIKAADDSHLWADTFDRKLTDLFSVESEVAKAIADQLRSKLTGQEEKVIAAKPTDNVEAYDAYLRGLAYTLKTSISSA